MKLFVLLFAVVISVVSAGVIENTIGSDFSDVKTNFKKGFKIIVKSLSKNIHPKVGELYKIFERSIDTDCAAEKVKKYELDDDLAEILSSDVTEHTDKQEKELAYIYGKTLQLCSSKSRPISDTIFDVIMSFGHIVRAFKDEPELAEIITFLKCANNYAVEKKLIDPSGYQLSYKYTDETEKQACDELKSGVLIKIKETLGKDDACSEQNTVEDTIHLTLRTILLTQVKLTPQQYQTESDYFYNQFNEIGDNSGGCEFKGLMTNETGIAGLTEHLGPIKIILLELGIKV